MCWDKQVGATNVSTEMTKVRRAEHRNVLKSLSQWSTNACWMGKGGLQGVTPGRFSAKHWKLLQWFQRDTAWLPLEKPNRRNLRTMLLDK